ncbi:tRNA pseudouridine(13) synthase TruD [Marinimicrobium alkaliphilum]|uniref:tRNA pseudouridine(13) synthase TruD n=1 Tax=Marinimicrobium alkaliphilum TaxID=2202654 RepID=UPI000DB94C37|nr:tRNA pseudouridine(13) synthase TruD [Marinimicrobium alkaliphilum]
MTEFDLNFPRVLGEPEARAILRATPEDFQVDEVLGFEPSGSGEHWCIHLRKRGQNTDWIARQLASVAGVESRDVSYCGLKDRHAVTTQWFSIYQPKGAEPRWSEVENDDVQLLQVTRHNRKLRRGQHRGNDFVIRLRDLQGTSEEALEPRLQRLAREGAPNYFGEQRFGREGGNLPLAQALLVERRPIRRRQERGLVLSAARSWLFNQVLAERVRQGNWRALIDGEPEAQASGPLWGRGRPLTSGELGALEQKVLAPWQAWCDGLEHVGLNQERRALQLLPEDLSWHWQGADLVLRFRLGVGTYATALLRELCDWTSA